MINRLLSALVAELEAGDVPDPCGERFTLAALWLDLARLAGEELPAHVAAAVLDARIALTAMAPTATRGAA